MQGHRAGGEEEDRLKLHRQTCWRNNEETHGETQGHGPQIDKGDQPHGQAEAGDGADDDSGALNGHDTGPREILTSAIPIDLHAQEDAQYARARAFPWHAAHVMPQRGGYQNVASNRRQWPSTGRSKRHPPPLVQATVNDQKLTGPMPGIAWTRVLFTRYTVHGTCTKTWCTIMKIKGRKMLQRLSCPKQLPWHTI